MTGIDQVQSHPALTDVQTGLANSLHFDLVYNYLFEAGNRGLPFTVMLVTAGAEGSHIEVIRDLGQRIAATTRRSDLVCHMGNGRYVVLLMGTNLQGGRIAADRIEVALEGKAPGSVSFGLVAYSDSYESAQTLLRAADTALLAAEATGGGVEFA